MKRRSFFQDREKISTSLVPISGLLYPFHMMLQGNSLGILDLLLFGARVIAEIFCAG